MIPMIVLLGVLLLAGVALWFWRRRSSDPARMLARGEALQKAGRAQEAMEILRRALPRLEASKPQSAVTPLITRACLALVDLYAGAGNRTEAFGYARKLSAQGGTLPLPVSLLLAEGYATDNDGSADAIARYLIFLADGPATGAVSERVCAALQTQCQITEQMKSAQRKERAALNRNVATVKPELDWPPYYLGLAELLDSHAEAALAYFQRAETLRPGQMNTQYWLGVCQLQQPTPNLEAAAAHIERYLALSETVEKAQGRAARVCSELGKRLVARMGGFTTTASLTPGQQADLRQAIHYFGIAMQREPGQAGHHHHLGQCHRLAGDATAAAAAFRSAVQLDPQNLDYLLPLAVALTDAGDRDEAMTTLERIVTLQPDHADARGRLGSLRFEAGDHSKAVEQLRAALGIVPGNPRWSGLLVRALYAQGLDAAVLDFVHALPAAHAALGQDLEAVYCMGRSCLRQGDTASALTWLDLVSERMDAQYYRGCALAQRNEYAPAAAIFDRLIAERTPYERQALLQRAHVRRLEGDVKGAEADYRQRLELDAQDAEALLWLGMLELGRDDLPQAAEYLAAAVRHAPEDGRAQLALGLVLERQGHAEQAVTCYAAVPLESESAAVAQLRLGILRCRRGEYTPALTHFDFCAGKGDASDALLFYRGIALAFLGHYDKAIADWNELAKRSPGHERLLLNLARAHYLRGVANVNAERYDEAIAAWNEYLALYPNDEGTVGDLAELHFRKASTLLRKGGAGAPAAMLTHIRKARTLAVDNPVYRHYEALGLMQAKDYKGAMAILKSSANGTRPDARARYHLALCLLLTGKRDEAVTLLEDLCGGEGGGDYAACAAYALGNEYLKLGAVAEAARILSAAFPQPAALQKAGDLR